MYLEEQMKGVRWMLQSLYTGRVRAVCHNYALKYTEHPASFLEAVLLFWGIVTWKLTWAHCAIYEIQFLAGFSPKRHSLQHMTKKACLIFVPNILRGFIFVIDWQSFSFFKHQTIFNSVPTSQKRRWIGNNCDKWNWKGIDLD